MRLHIDALGWLHLAWGAFGLLTGTSLFILAFAARQVPVAVGVLVTVGAVLFLGGAFSVLVGWGIRRLRGRARLAALGLAVPNLLLVPFGSALAVYTFWVLLNNDAREVFGHAPRMAPQ